MLRKDRQTIYEQCVRLTNTKGSALLTKKVFSDPDVRARQIASLKATMNEPEFKKGLAERSKICQSRPDVIEKKSNGTRELHRLRKLFTEATGYKGKYSMISRKMMTDYFYLRE